MTTGFWLPMLTKAVATALLVVSASALAEALGPFWGALIGSLPISAGPAYVFLAMQHGPDFVAASALSSLAGNAATGLFLIVYAMRAGRMRLWPGLAVAVGTWLAASQATRLIGWTPGTALALNAAVYGAGFVLVRSVERAPEPIRPALKRPWFELPARGLGSRHLRFRRGARQFGARAGSNGDCGGVPARLHQPAGDRTCPDRRRRGRPACSRRLARHAGLWPGAASAPFGHPRLGCGSRADDRVVGVSLLVRRPARAQAADGLNSRWSGR